VLHAISCTDHRTVSFTWKLDMETVQFLSWEPIADRVLAEVDLSMVREFFTFDFRDQKLILKYFSWASLLVKNGLVAYRNPSMFVRAFALAIMVPCS
jgi:hypothetical protein